MKKPWQRSLSSTHARPASQFCLPNTDSNQWVMLPEAPCLDPSRSQQTPRTPAWLEALRHQDEWVYPEDTGWCSTQSYTEKACPARHLTKTPAFPTEQSTSINHTLLLTTSIHSVLCCLGAISISEMSKPLQQCGDKKNTLFALHIDNPISDCQSAFSYNRKCTKLALLVLTTTKKDLSVTCTR